MRTRPERWAVWLMVAMAAFAVTLGWLLWWRINEMERRLGDKLDAIGTVK